MSTAGRIYFVAGEASGDLHASNLAAELIKINPALKMRGWGGDLMQARGVEIVKHYRDLAFMGFLEVIKNLRTIFRNLDDCEKDILAFKPDAVILVDYPGFNIRIAKKLKKKGIRVFYYISPQIWAWKQSRVHTLKDVVDKMFVILPFEKEFYARFGMDVKFVGHPLLDALDNYAGSKPSREVFCAKNKLDPAKPIVAILPGSRKQEIEVKLPVMIEMQSRFPDFQFVVAGAPSAADEWYAVVIGSRQIPVIKNQTYDLLSVSYAAMVTSGTATLETALFNVPEVVCYKGSKVSYLIAKQLVKIKYISLVNLVMDDLVVRELIQDEFNISALEEEMDRLLNDDDYREKMMNAFMQLRQKLGGSGASALTANLMLKSLAD